MYYEPYRQETETRINFRFYWDKNTTKGLGIAIALAIVTALILSSLTFNPYSIKELDRSDSTRYIPTVLLIFGEGDGTGARKGNLSAEGAAMRGEAPAGNLDDATKAGSTEYSPQNTTPQDPDNASNLIPRTKIASGSKNVTDRNGSDSRNIGSKNGSTSGTGLGSQGNGPGKGLGLGDIDWGGGGNRVVRNHPKPEYPKGLTVNTSIRMKFVVAPDGSVTKVVPDKRGGDPRLEKVAREALQKWTFNRISENIEMTGYITFTFKVN